MPTYTFRTCNAERCYAVHRPITTTVEAPDEATARHRAMVERYGPPGGANFPFSSKPLRYYGLGLILESSEE